MTAHIHSIKSGKRLVHLELETTLPAADLDANDIIADLLEYFDQLTAARFRLDQIILVAPGAEESSAVMSLNGETSIEHEIMILSKATDSLRKLLGEQTEDTPA